MDKYTKGKKVQNGLIQDYGQQTSLLDNKQLQISPDLEEETRRLEENLRAVRGEQTPIEQVKEVQDIVESPNAPKDKKQAEINITPEKAILTAPKETSIQEEPKNRIEQLQQLIQDYRTKRNIRKDKLDRAQAFDVASSLSNQARAFLNLPQVQPTQFIKQELQKQDQESKEMLQALQEEKTLQSFTTGIKPIKVGGKLVTYDPNSGKVNVVFDPGDPEAAKENPNSEVSKKAQQQFIAAGGLKALETFGQTPEEARESVKKFDAKFLEKSGNALFRKLPSAATKLSEKRFEFTKSEKDELSDKQLGDLNNFDNILRLSDEINLRKKSIDTGPLQSAKEKALSFFGANDPEFASFKSDTIDQLVSYIRSISGTAVSDQERKLLVNSVPDVSDNDAVFEAKLKAFQDRVKNNKNIFIENVKKQQGKLVKAPKQEANKKEEVYSPEIEARIQNVLKANKGRVTRDQVIEALKKAGKL